MKVIAEVRDGSLISLDETQVVDKALCQSLKWAEVPNSRHTAGNYFQCCYSVELPENQAFIANQAIKEYRSQFGV